MCKTLSPHLIQLQHEYKKLVENYNCDIQEFITVQDPPAGITVTDVTRVLQMLEASRNASRNALRFADTIEYTMFAQTSGIT